MVTRHSRNDLAPIAFFGSVLNPDCHINFQTHSLSNKGEDKFPFYYQNFGAFVRAFYLRDYKLLQHVVSHCKVLKLLIVNMGVGGAVEPWSSALRGSLQLNN